MPHDNEIKAILAMPATSAWLRAALENALTLDCVDAANDAEVLSGLLERRCHAILACNQAPAT